MSQTWTPLKLVAWTQGYFARSGIDAPRLTSELLLARALDCDRLRIYLDFDKPLAETELERYRALVKRRAEGEPTAYIINAKEFMGRSFQCDARALIPRPETELLVESALSALPAGGSALDLGTGSGCIGVTLSLERPQAHVIATDVSADALALAHLNAERFGARLEFMRGDLFDPIPAQIRFDVIAANPPYVPSAEMGTLAREVKREPALALDGGDDGLSVMRRVVLGAPARLRPGGTLLLEMHESHEARLPALCLEVGFASAGVRRDLAGLPRFVVARATG
ncbi:MAG TPA: peptide chain release factor N(5)-glutamine methyltransferase [Anaeromyxobacteraceae bacterium]|nr:peptide chain release factor N(5)-glutamine methyltransferase [Anaeromyxobacteraceae bacterium]